MKRVNLLFSLLFLVTTSCVDGLETGYLVTAYTDAEWTALTKKEVLDNNSAFPYFTELSDLMSGFPEIDQLIVMDLMSMPDGKSDYQVFWAGSDLHQSLSQKHNDVAPSPIGRFGSVARETGCYYYYKDFTELKVFAEEDFDEDHPAGSSLLDLLHFGTNTPNRVLLNHYQWRFSSDVLMEENPLYPEMKDKIDGIEPYYQVFNTFKLGTAVRPSDITILGFFALSFDKLPEPVVPKHIHICLTADDGSVYEYAKELTFEKINKP